MPDDREATGQAGRRWYEEALRASEERLRVALQASPAVVFNQDLELRYTWIHNPRQPFTRDQVLGKTDFDLLPSAEADQLVRIKSEVLASGTGTRAVVRITFEGEPRFYDLIVEPLRDRDGSVVGITCATWDITDQRQSEAAQQFLAAAGRTLMAAPAVEEEVLRAFAALALRELADWVIIDVEDPDRGSWRRVTAAEPHRQERAAALERIALDRTRPHLLSEALEQRESQLVAEPGPEYLRSVAQRAEHLELLRSMEMRSILTVPLLAHDRLFGAMALISSGRSRPYGERDLRIAEELARLVALAIENAQLHRDARRAIASRDEVLAIVAHDLRAPLNNILLRSELTEDRTIHRAAQRMARLIRDMLDVACLDTGQLPIERGRLASRDLLEEILASHLQATSAAELHIRLDAPDRLPDLLADRDRLLQVFENLLANAIKFSPPGGGIVIGAAPEDGQVRFWVADEGPGIAPDQLELLFERFWRADAGDRRGAGLGLAIARGIVEAHGGRIWAESEPGQGATFHVSLPAATGPAGADFSRS